MSAWMAKQLEAAEARANEAEAALAAEREVSAAFAVRLQRAEADNAEMVNALELCRETMQEEGWDEYAAGHPKRRAYEACLVPAGVTHPGAAMLERMRKMEALIREVMEGPRYVKIAWIDRAADALKVPHE